MSSEAERLRERVAELEERLDTLAHGQARLERGVRDEHGRTWTMADFLGMGLTRRQALGTMAAIAGGAALPTALVQQARADASLSDSDSNVGEPGDLVDVFADGVDANSVDADDVAVAGSDFVASGDSFGSVGFWKDDAASTTSNTYTDIYFYFNIQFDRFIPANATARWTLGFSPDDGGDQLDVKLFNVTDSEDMVEGTNVGSGGTTNISGTYTPTTTSSSIRVAIRARNSDGSTSVTVTDPTLMVAVDV